MSLEQRAEVEDAHAVTTTAAWRHELEDLASDESDEDRERRMLGFAPNLHLRNEIDREQCRIEYGPSDGATLDSLRAVSQEQPEFDLELAGYVMIHGGTRVQIWCAAPLAPADDWLSITETFEFLPAEE